jgi:hypothetical protein
MSKELKNAQTHLFELILLKKQKEYELIKINAELKKQTDIINELLKKEKNK